MKTHIQSHIVTLLACLVLLAGCSSKKDSIVGKWQSTNGKAWSEYFSDGTVTISDGIATFSGKYTFLEDGRIKIELGALGRTTTWRVDFDGDTLTFTAGDHEHKEVYRRAR